MTYSPRLKAEASTLNVPAKANLRLTGTPVACRCPCTLDVNGRIVVTVNDQTARAMQCSVAKGEVMASSTARTDTGSWRKAVNLDHRFATPEGNPFQDAQEFGEAQVAHLAPPLRFHAFEVQVFEAQDIQRIAQCVRQLKMMIVALMSDGRLVFCQGAAGLLVAIGAFDFARQFTSQASRLAQTLLVELWAGIAPVLVINEEVFQSKVKAAAVTRAGFGNDDFLDDAEDKPQPAHSIPLDS